MRRFSQIIDIINERVGKFVSFGMIFLIGCMVYEVVARYVFNNPTIWANETAQLFFGTMLVMAGGYSLLHNQMIKMDVLYNRFSIKTRAIIDLCTFIIAFICLAVLVWKSWLNAWSSLMWLEKSSTTWNPPVYPAKLILPIGAFLLLMQFISKFIKDFYIATGRNSSEH